MSARQMARVYDYQFTHGEQSVLLAMADHADDDGRHIFPSIAYLSWKTDYSERQIQRTIHDLTKRGVLIVVAAAHAQRATEYRLNLAAAPKKAAFNQRGDTTTPLTGDTMSRVTPRQVTSATQRGDISDERGDIAMSPEPSLEPSKRIKEIPPVAIATSPTGGKRATAIPADAQLSENMILDAEHIGVKHPDAEFLKFKDYHLAKGSTMKDWRAAWRTWCRNSLTFNRGSPNGHAPRAAPVTFEQQKQINNAAAWAELDAVVKGTGNGLRPHIQAADEPPRRRLPGGDPGDDDGSVLDGVFRER